MRVLAHAADNGERVMVFADTLSLPPPDARLARRPLTSSDPAPIPAAAMLVLGAPIAFAASNVNGGVTIERANDGKTPSRVTNLLTGKSDDEGDVDIEIDVAHAGLRRPMRAAFMPAALARAR